VMRVSLVIVIIASILLSGVESASLRRSKVPSASQKVLQEFTGQNTLNENPSSSQKVLQEFTDQKTLDANRT